MPSMPQNETAERSVIGISLNHGVGFELVSDLLKVEDFYDPKHAAIFAAMKELASSGESIDMITTHAKMIKQGTSGILAAYGDFNYLIDLTLENSYGINVRKHAEIVREKSIMRKLILEATKIRDMAYSETDLSAEEVVNAAQIAIMGLSDIGVKKEPVKLKKIINDTIKVVEYNFHHKGAITGVPSGLTWLDELTGGWQGANLIVVAGRPGMAKTSLVLNVAIHAAEHKYPGLIFSVEMPNIELGQRILSIDALVDNSVMKTGMMEDKDWFRLSNSAVRMADHPLWIDDDGNQDLYSIVTKSRRWRMDKTIFPTGSEKGFIMVDYLQLVKSSITKKYQNREREVADISATLKALSKQLNLPVIAVASLNRKCDERADKRPLMSDLKESGAIESDADLVILLYRDEEYNKKTTEPGIAEIIIGKHRGGPTGTVKVGYIKSQTRFTNLSQRAQ